MNVLWKCLMLSGVKSRNESDNALKIGATGKILTFYHGFGDVIQWVHF